MSLWFERGYPWLFGIAAALLAWLQEAPLPEGDKLSALLSASISVSAILVGFLATMKSIVMAIPSIANRLRQSDYLSLLASYLSTATAANLLFCVLNIAGFFVWIARHGEIFAPAWFGFGVVALLSFWRVTNIMVLVLQWEPPKPE